jgi:predicted transposase YbfD/YdcC
MHVMARPLGRSLVEIFEDLPDPRIDRHKQHQLVDIVVVTICSILCGAKSWVDVEEFGEAKLEWFRKFVKLANGIPSHDTIGRVFSLLSATEFEARIRQWMAEIVSVLGLDHVAIDGKTARGSRNFERVGLHLVSAYATADGITVGQQAVDEKSNEITAIPELLKTLEIAGALVTIDAMGCQTKIAEEIRGRKADYMLAVKENQPTLFEDIHQFALAALEKEYEGVSHDYFESSERSHGRNEYRACYVFSASDVVKDLTPWKDLKSVVMIVSEREVKGEASSEVRYYISSRKTSAKEFASMARRHWGIENGLHWTLDVTMGEDASRVRKGNGAKNFALLRRLAVSVLKKSPCTRAGQSVRSKCLVAGWDPQFLERLLEEFLQI